MRTDQLPRPLLIATGLLLLLALPLLLLGLRLGGWLGLLLGGAGVLGLVLPVVLAWQLRQQDTAGWLITWDLAEPLQFAAYVGDRAGFHPATVHAADSPLERDWQQWWAGLVDDTLAHEAGLEATLRAHADLPPQALARLIARPTHLAYDPPTFAALADRPALQARCQEQWPDFTTIWALEKPALLAKMRQQGGRVRENRIVRTCARAAGTIDVPAFFLRLDFVRWPEVYQRQRAPQQLVLGTYYLERAAAKELKALIAAAVRELITA